MDSLDVKNGVAYLHPEDGSSPAYAEGNWAAEYARRLMDAEETARENMDKELQGRIETETDARQGADGTLNFEVCKAGNLTDAINAETRKRKEEIGDLGFYNGAGNITRAINVEYEARSKAEERIAENEKNITANEISIKNEKTAREAADNNLRTAIVDSTGGLQEQIDGIQSDIVDKGFALVNLTAKCNNTKKSVETLQKQVTAEQAARESADISNKLKNLEDYEITYAGDGLNAYGNYDYDNFPLGLYIFSPVKDVDSVFLHSADGLEPAYYISEGKLLAGNTYIIDFQDGESKLIHTFKAGGLYFFADYDVDYLEQGADSYDLYVYTKNTIDDFPFGKYIFSPALDVGTVVIYTKNGDVIQSYDGKLAAGNTYIIDFQFEGSKLIHTIEAGNGSLDGSGSLSGVPDGSGASELKWQTILDTVFETDAVFSQVLPVNCVGVKITIHAPADVPIPAMQIYPRSNSTWIYPVYCPGYGTTASTVKDKLVRIEWKQENGIYTYNSEVKTGAGNYNGTKLYSFPESGSNNPTYQYDVSKYPTLYDIRTGGELKAGTTIKVWGLIEE